MVSRTLPGQVRQLVLKVSSTKDLQTQRFVYFDENSVSRSLHLFLELWENDTDEEHVQTYLWLGHSYKQMGRTREIRACYEMGLLIALHAHNLHSEYKLTYRVRHFRKHLYAHSEDKQLLTNSIEPPAPRI